MTMSSPIFFHNREKEDYLGAQEAAGSSITETQKRLQLQIREKENNSKRIHFVLCQKCFWCASAISFTVENQYNYNRFSYCPACSDNKIEFVPMVSNEPYKFEYDMKRGVTLGFERK